MDRISEILKSQKLNVFQAPQTSPTRQICEVTPRERILKDLRLQEPIKTFGNFKVNDELMRTYKAFRGIVDGDYKMLLCFGGTGSGKSHLLKATVLRLYGKKIFCRYYEWHVIVGALKRGLDRGSVPPYDEILMNYCKAPALLIDDYGLGSTNTPWEQSQFEVIINYRYDRQLITVVTTNLLPDEIPDRVMSRFKDTDVSLIVVNRSSDYRRRSK